MPDQATTLTERNAQRAHGLMRRTGRLPVGLIPPLIESSWLRCLAHGPSLEGRPEFDPGRRDDLDLMRQRNMALMGHALPIMETLYEQIANTQSMVVLSDASGFILHSLGDDDFLAKAQRVALAPGVEWSECCRGTNAIGTALTEKAPVVVHGAQHFLPANHFLTCSAAPLRDPYGRIVGVLDVTGDHRRFSPHTLALANMSVKMIENHLFCHTFSDVFVVRLHARPEFLGTLCEGLAAFREDGRFLSANQSGRFQFGLEEADLRDRAFDSLFGLPLSAALDLAARAAPSPCPLLLHNGIRVFVRIEAAPHKLHRPLHEMRTGEEAADRRHEALTAAMRQAISRQIPLLIEHEEAATAVSLAACLRRHLAEERAWLEFDCAEADTGRLDEFLGCLLRRMPGSVPPAAEVVFLGNVHKLDLARQSRLVAALLAALPPQGRELPFALISSSQGKLHRHVARKDFRHDLYYRLSGSKVALPAPTRCADAGEDLDSITRQAIEAALDAANGNVSAAARKLGISRSTLYRRLRDI